MYTYKVIMAQCFSVLGAIEMFTFTRKDPLAGRLVMFAWLLITLRVNSFSVILKKSILYLDIMGFSSL